MKALAKIKQVLFIFITLEVIRMDNPVVRREIDRLIVHDGCIADTVVKALVSSGYDADISVIKKSESDFPVAQAITVYRTEEIKVCRL
jgi:hypothetical protein